VALTTPSLSVDLTPFGFTPTESAAYEGLLENGPSSGYGLARVLGVARTNAYQALRGLVVKGAASVEGEDPQIYRAIRPDTLLALVVGAEEAKLELLEQQLASRRRGGKEATVPFDSEREFSAIALRTATREPGPVACLAPLSVLSALVPIWRKRAADGAETNIWVLGDTTDPFPIPVAGQIPQERAVGHFGSPVVILTTGASVGIGRIVEDRVSGLWSSDPIIVGAVKAALQVIST
jgi:hypothetical protein